MVIRPRGLTVLQQAATSMVDLETYFNKEGNFRHIQYHQYRKRNERYYLPPEPDSWSLHRKPPLGDEASRGNKLGNTMLEVPHYRKPPLGLLVSNGFAEGIVNIKLWNPMA
ncbi:hypothetical protein RJT34_23236 [Clitoria ternatea]|uniref:Uncharacterized protein n=1 Tax=Clitoria ternatea TaxID=43366 RepID=A0AAN9FNG8_CLITE